MNTVICDRCGNSYFVSRVVGTAGQLLRLLCPHCGNLLWSTVPRHGALAEAAARRDASTKFPRGVS